MDTLFFSVIIPTYNRRDSLMETLQAFVGQDYPPTDFEVIVAVDGSTDGTAGVLKEFKAPFSFTILELENGGPGKARNAAAGLSRARFLAFSEDDVLPDVDWLRRAQEYLRAGTLDVLEGRTVYRGTSTSVRKFETGSRLSFIPCNLFVRRSLFVSLGGYSTEFHDASSGLYFREDSDFGFRLKDAQARIALAGDLVVAHPPQFLTLAGCLRHARRYIFDPLLFKRNPLRFRQDIEVKQILGFTIHRAQHYVALFDLLAVGLLLAGAMLGRYVLACSGLGAICLCGVLFKLKYQGQDGLRFGRLNETAGFLVLPFVYLASVVKGCIRFRVFGLLW